MNKPIAAPEQLADMPFPLSGLDLSVEYERQTPGSTPIGLNVRGFEPLTMRQRGGSRPGLSQYIPEQVGDVKSVIQHLNFVVDPTEAAVLDNFDDDPNDLLDPSNNPPGRPIRNNGLRTIRRGGTGRQANIHTPMKKGAFKRVQVASNFNGGLPGTLSFSSAVKKGDLIIFIYALDPSNTANDPGFLSFSDNQGNSYTQVGYETYGGPFSWTLMGVPQAPFDNGVNLAMFYTVASANGPLTVSYSGTASAVNGDTWLLEYSGNKPIPLDGVATQVVTRTDFPANMFNLPYAGKSVPVTSIVFGGAGDLVVVAFLDCNGSLDFNSGFKDEFASVVPVGLILDNINVKASVTVQGTAFSPYSQVGPFNTDSSGNPLPTEFVYLFVGASFKAATPP
jgi:hypothetical protein